MRQKLILVVIVVLAASTQNVFAQIQVTVDILGLNKTMEENVLLLLSIEQQKSSELISVGRLKRLHNKAPQEISKALQPYGYYQTTVTSKLIVNNDNSWLASYQVMPGNPVPIGVYDFKVDDHILQDMAFNELIDGFKLKAGTTFNHIEYEKIKSDLARLASERGYFNAHFTQHRVEIDMAKYQANVAIHFEGGPRFHFGDVILSSTLLNEELLRRYVPFKKGDPYTLNRLIELQQALNDSDFFSVVEVTPGKLDAETYQIPVEVLLTARKRHRLSFGLGYGTDTGARTLFGWQIPRLNAKGHRVNTNVNYSEIGYSLGTQYSLPVFNPRTDQLIYSAGIVNEKTDTSESTIDTVGVSINQTRGKWRKSMSLNYQREKFSVADTEGNTTLLIPGMNWNRIWGKDFWGNQILQIFDGARLDLGVRFATEDLLSDADFVQLNGSIKSLHRISSSHRFIFRGKLGYIQTDEFESLPTSIRFFAGGAQSLRGYSYQSIGPIDEDGEVIGGQYLIEGSAEYEYSFNERWGMALFVDAGNAIDNLDDDLQKGAGFGLRWKSPVGPVRVDLASAISTEDEPWRLHINIGPDL